MQPSDLGPVEYAVIAFPGNHFHGEIAAELQRLTDQGVVRIIDLTFVLRDTDGSLVVRELDALDAEDADLFAALDGEVNGLVSEEDIALIAEEVPPGNSAAIIVWENSWAKRLAQAVRRADGQVISQERVPQAIAERSFAAAAV
ncbi:DUF6325 family protein [Phaeacidiphilus oryzae]|uniref:DUF6325 family protein n=1 Tax=Phaeacidiphilus oryzae TaxID=348818 RepID=UPI00056C7676|nr:DUF6325 family protein [Phaeacidiphilus oryzae]